MYPISAVFADYLRRFDRTFVAHVEVDGKVYDSSVIIDFSLENSLTMTDEFEIGTAIPSKLILRLRTQDAVPPNARVKPYLAMDAGMLSWGQAGFPWGETDIAWGGGETDALPLGEFYVDGRERVGDIWTYTCYDKLVFADGAYLSSLTYPATQRAVWDEICRQTGYTYDSSVVINSSYRIPVAPTGYSNRQVMGWIAASNAASVYAGKDGVLRFKRFGAAGTAPVNLAASDYIRVRQTNPVKAYTRVVVTVDSENEVVYEAGEGGEDQTLQVLNPFGTQAMTNALLVSLSGFSYQPITMDSRGFPHLDQGDELIYEKYESRPWGDSHTPWGSTDVPWGGMTNHRSIILRQRMAFRGGLTHSIVAPSISAQRSEFPVAGTLKEALNNLSKQAVKEGRNYFGFSVTREEGMRISRSDGRSELLLNSDIMDWRVGGQSTLYFDSQANRLKFGGTLEGVDGIFSGTVQGGQILGGSIQIGTGFSVNSAGHMIAVGAEFSGTISASIITGGQINGTTITGASIRTATSGERIELDPYGFRFYDSGGARRVELGTNVGANIVAHSYYNSSGQAQGLIYANPSELHVMGNYGLRLGASFGTIVFQGNVQFSNGSVLGLSLGIGQVAGLQEQLNSLSSQIASLANAFYGHSHTVNVGTHNHGIQGAVNWGGTFTTSGP